MQLSLKTLLLIGTLAGLAMASGGKYHQKDYYQKDYHRKGGVIKRTILIDGCTGQPIEKHPYPTPMEEIDTRPPPPRVVPEIQQPDFDESEFRRDVGETIFEDENDSEDAFDFFNGDFQDFDDGTFGDDGANLVYRDEPTFQPL